MGDEHYGTETHKTVAGIPLATGLLIIRKGNYLVYVGYCPSTSTFSPHQLEPYVPLALARMPTS